VEYCSVVVGFNMSTLFYYKGTDRGRVCEII